MPPLAFVVHKHRATQLHYDFRLELAGVLLSWAVPKGPSLIPSQKRLAVQVDDHELAYGGFEGTLSKDGYGGGAVMIWDCGTWEPTSKDGRDAAEDYRRGRLSFVLRGEKLKGRWHLMRSNAGDRKSWLLFKGADAEARRTGSIVDEAPLSVVSGRTLEQISGAATAP